MSPILSELFHQFNPTAPSPEYQAAQDRLCACIDQVREVFPSAFTEELESAAFHLSGLDAQESFAYGLRFGLTLAQELNAL